MDKPQIIIIHTDYNSIAGIDTFLRTHGFAVKHFATPLAAFKLLLGINNLAGFILQKDSKPLSAYKTIDYIKSELKINSFFAVLTSGDDTETKLEDTNVDFKLSKSATPADLQELIAAIKKQLDSENITENLYSLDYLKEVSDNNLPFIKESLLLFKNSVAKDVEELYFKLKSASYNEIRQLAHRIKPSFAMVCSQKGIELCDEITYQVEDAGLEKKIVDLQKTYQEIVAAITSDFPNLN